MSRAMRNILVVDDNAANRKLLGVIVQEMGWSYRAVENGAEAVQACADEGPFDLILMDYRMPGMDGADATATIRAECGWAAQIPVIGITADDSQTARARCLAAGMLTCLSKPIQPLAVAALMRRALDPAKGEPELGQLAAG
jgi:CheY-like chemotaxis protein